MQILKSFDRSELDFDLLISTDDLKEVAEIQANGCFKIKVKNLCFTDS